MTFETDTVSFDTLFATVPSSAQSFWIRNNSADGIRCKEVRLEGGNQTGFRVNVDGEYMSPERGYKLNDIEVRKGDSIRVFVEVTTPKALSETPRKIEDNIVFTLESGVQQKVNLNAWAWDAVMKRGWVIDSDQTITGEKPIIVYDSMVVKRNVLLTIAAGTTIYFHKGAGIDVQGTLVCEGTAERPVVLRGDRLDNMFDYLPYDLVSGQWRGITFGESSYGNRVTFTDLHSADNAVVCDSSSIDREKLKVEYSTIHNNKGFGILSSHSVVNIVSSQITNCLANCVYADGGRVSILQSTIAQFYPFQSVRGWGLLFANMTKAEGDKDCGIVCLNSIITGFDDDVICADLSKEDSLYTMTFDHDVLRTERVKGELASNFTNIIWEKELEDSLAEKRDTTLLTGRNMFKLVSHETQHYDFHLAERSCAVGMGSADYARLAGKDRDGLPFDEQKTDLGCYSTLKSQSDSSQNSARRRRNW
ncbi:MAG: right-handed parallel beta-helix repeat-containing protein [Bacteroidaceae bacterium]|nr:right-handed parallel beta-helix repeat-containing protein [Bacteroidaceae bacterium]